MKTFPACTFKDKVFVDDQEVQDPDHLRSWVIAKIEDPITRRPAEMASLGQENRESATTVAAKITS